MRYQGGKSPESRFIGPFLNRIRKPKQPYWEPFVGAGSVLARITGEGNHFASDLHPQLIKMWQALQTGWKPPYTVSEELYAFAKQGHLDPATTAFIGFGCSWGAKWFGGYARHNGRGDDFARGSYNSLMQKLRTIPPNTAFFCCDYRKWLYPEPMLIYCDPPYKGRIGFKGLPPFNHDQFWEWCRVRSREGHTVAVSAFDGPPDFETVLTVTAGTETRNREGRRREVERLLIYEHDAYFYDPLFDTT